jgi:hypothetical protein
MTGRLARIAPMIGRGPRSSPRLGWARTIGRRFRVVRPRIGAALAILRRVSPARLLRLRLAWSTSRSTAIAVAPMLRTATLRLAHSALVVRSTLSTILRTRADGAAGSPAASVQVLSPPSRGRSPWVSPTAPGAARHDVRRPDRRWPGTSGSAMDGADRNARSAATPEAVPTITTALGMRRSVPPPSTGGAHRGRRCAASPCSIAWSAHPAPRAVAARAAQAVRDSLAVPAPPAAPPALDLERPTKPSFARSTSASLPIASAWGAERSEQPGR